MCLPCTRRPVVVLCLVLCVAVGSSLAQDNARTGFASKVDSLFAGQVDPDGPGAAVAVIEHGKVVYRHCFGLASLEYGAPITSETVFNLASVAKQFTALAVLMLEQEGKLSLGDDIHKYFPELPDYGAEVTLNNLLHHTSGLWEYSSMFTYYGGNDPVDRMDMNEVLKMLKSQDQLLFSPGGQWKYCNTNYALLAEMIARTTGESFASWMKKHIFDPLGMQSTLFRDDYHEVIPRLAGCYYKSDGIYKRNPSNSEVIGEGYLFSTIDDVLRWLDNFRTHTVGGDSLIQRMFEKSSLSDGSENFYGYGVGVSDYHGKLSIGHSGQTGSFITMVIYVPEDEIGVAVLANNRRIRSEPLGYQVLDLFYGWPKEPEATAAAEEPEPFISPDSIDAKGPLGAYLIDGGMGRLFLSRLENGFYGIFDGLGSDLFYPISDTVFVTKLRDVRIYMQRSEDADSERIMLYLKGDTIWASHISPPSLTAQQLSVEYAGTYFCKPVGAAYEVVVDDGYLVIRNSHYTDQTLMITDKDEFTGSIGIVRFTRNEQGKVTSFEVTDEDTNFKPIKFKRI